MSATNMVYTRDPSQRAVPRERRLNMRLMAFWWDRRADRRFPTREDFDPNDLSDVWANCFALVPREPTEDSWLEFIGGSFAEASQPGNTAIKIGDLPENSLLRRAAENVPKVLEQRIPLVGSGELVDDDGQEIMFRSILLPLSEDQETVDCLIGGARCKLKHPH